MLSNIKKREVIILVIAVTVGIVVGCLSHLMQDAFEERYHFRHMMKSCAGEI